MMIGLQNTLNDLIGRFQECRRDIDNVISVKDHLPVEISKVEEKIKGSFDLVEGVKKDISNIILSITNHVNSSVSNHSILNQNLEVVKKQVEEAFKIIEEHKFHIGNTSERLGKIEDKQSQYVDKGQILELSNGLKDFSDKANADILSLRLDMKNAIESLTLSNQNIFQEGITNKELFLKKVIEFEENYEQLKNSLNQKKVEMDGAIQDIKSGMKTIIENIILNLPKPEIPSLDEAKAAMKKELEPSALDAKNANLRSTNCENEIMILKKKIESLELTIKKLDIEGQK